jgi:phosphohistidine phosphatase
MPDDYRVLSPGGREIVGRIGRWCVEQHIRIEQIISSPLVRAVQTAEILSGLICPEKDVEVALPLTAGSSTGDLLRFLPLHQHLKSLALIGHEPTMGMMVSALLNLEKKVSFSPGAICCLALHGADQTPRASFGWMVQPAIDAKTKVISLNMISSVDALP